MKPKSLFALLLAMTLLLGLLPVQVWAQEATDRLTITVTEGQSTSVEIEEGLFEIKFTPAADGLYWIYFDSYYINEHEVTDASGKMVPHMQLTRYMQEYQMRFSGVIADLKADVEYTFLMYSNIYHPVMFNVLQVQRAESFTISEPSVTDYYGTLRGVSVEFYPEGSVDFLTVTSDNEDVVTLDNVSSDAIYFHLLAPGNAKLTVSNGTDSCEIQVTVKDADGIINLDEPVYLTLAPEETYALAFTPSESDDYIVRVDAPAIDPGFGYGKMFENHSSSFRFVSQDSTVLLILRNYGNATAEGFPVTISKLQPVESLSLNHTELTMETGDEIYLEAVFEPWNSMEEIDRFEFDNPDAAGFYYDNGFGGYVHAYMPGTTTLTVISRSGKTATCEITVTPKTYPTATVTLNQTQRLVLEEDGIDVLFTPEEDGYYLLAIPFNGPYRNISAVLDPNGNAIEHKNTENGNDYGVYAALEAGKTYTYRILDEYREGGSFDVTIKKVTPATTVTLNTTEIEGYAGSTAYLYMEVGPNEVADVTYQIEDESIATIQHQSGTQVLINLEQPGTTTVTATLPNGASATCTIKVKAPKTISVGEPTQAPFDASESRAFTFTAPEAGYYIIYVPRNGLSLEWDFHTENYFLKRVYLDEGESFNFVVSNWHDTEYIGTVTVDLAPELETVALEGQFTGYIGEHVSVNAIFTPELAIQNLCWYVNDTSVVELWEEFGTSTYMRLRKAGTVTLTAGDLAGFPYATVTITSKPVDKVMAPGDAATFTLAEDERYAIEFKAPETGLYYLYTENKDLYMNIQSDAEFFHHNDQAYGYVLNAQAGDTYMVIIGNDSNVTGQTATVHLDKAVEPEDLTLTIYGDHTEHYTGFVGEVIIGQASFDPLLGLPLYTTFGSGDEEIAYYAYNYHPYQHGVLLKKVGTTTLTMKYGNLSDTCQVTVVEPDEISLTQSGTYELAPGERAGFVYHPDHDGEYALVFDHNLSSRLYAEQYIMTETDSMPLTYAPWYKGVSVLVVVTNDSDETVSGQVQFKEAEKTFGYCGDDILWYLVDGVLTLTGTGEMYNYGMEDQPWSSFAKEITSVVVEEGITHIGSGAFHGCENLTSVSLPESIESIGSAAFRFAPLTDIEIPANVTTIYHLTFQQNAFTDVTIPVNVTHIYSLSFSQSQALSSVIIEGNLVLLDDMVFSNCPNLSEIKFYGDAPEEIGEYAFGNITATVYYPEGNETWADVITGQYGGQITWVSYQFRDVDDEAYYAAPVEWAVEMGITTGTGDGSTFSPDRNCTRAQVVTFLWRAAGKPNPQNATHSFTDVKAGSYYETAVMWAVEQGITGGTGDGTTFSPDRECTRAEVVTFLWRAAGKPEPQMSSNPFPDVPAGSWYEKAVMWAVENGITTGKGNGTFAPTQICTRGQVVTFLYRDLWEAED